MELREPPVRPVAGHTRRALGRGLDALLPASTPAVVEPGETVREIPVADITPNPYQPRQHFDSAALQELAESIRVHGLVQPITVRREGERYILIAGERRWRAAALAGRETIPAIVRQVPEAKTLELTLIENIQREDLNPIETAEAFARLAHEANLTHEQIAERTGKDRATVTNLLRLLKLPSSVQRQVASGALSLGHAKVLLSLKDHKDQLLLAQKITEKGLSVRQTEELVRQSIQPRLSQPSRPRNTGPSEDPNVQAALRDIERSLGTRVRLVGSEQRGKFIIEYHSSEERDRLYSLLVGKTSA